MWTWLMRSINECGMWNSNPAFWKKKSTFIWLQLRKEIWNLKHIWRTYNKIVELPLPCHGTIANSVAVSNSIHMLGCWKLQNTGDHRTYFRNVCRFQSDEGWQKWPNPNCEAKVRNYNFLVCVICIDLSLPRKIALYSFPYFSRLSITKVQLRSVRVVLISNSQVMKKSWSFA